MHLRKRKGIVASRLLQWLLSNRFGVRVSTMNGFLPIAIILAVFGQSSQVFAWSATAIGDDAYSYTTVNRATPEEANDAAITECQKVVRNCKLLGDPVRATSIVLVKSGLFVQRVAAQNPEAAAQDAMKACSEEHTGCFLAAAYWDEGPTWAALADGTDASKLQYNAFTAKEAEDGALASCHEASANPDSCKLTYSGQEHFWYAMVGLDSRTTATGVSTSSRKEAIKSATETCRKAATHGSKCKLEGVFENTGPTPAPTSFRTLAARIEREQKLAANNQRKVVSQPQSANCRPRTATIRCQSSCSNGDCVVSYENGCKMRVQVAPKFNPFNNQWEYPSPSC